MMCRVLKVAVSGYYDWLSTAAISDPAAPWSSACDRPGRRPFRRSAAGAPGARNVGQPHGMFVDRPVRSLSVQRHVEAVEPVTR